MRSTESPFERTKILHHSLNWVWSEVMDKLIISMSLQSLINNTNVYVFPCLIACEFSSLITWTLGSPETVAWMGFLAWKVHMLSFLLICVLWHLKRDVHTEYHIGMVGLVAMVLVVAHFALLTPLMIMFLQSTIAHILWVYTITGFGFIKLSYEIEIISMVKLRELFHYDRGRLYHLW